MVDTMRALSESCDNRAFDHASWRLTIERVFGDSWGPDQWCPSEWRVVLSVPGGEAPLFVASSASGLADAVSRLLRGEVDDGGA